MSRLPDAGNTGPDAPTPEEREARIRELREKRHARRHKLAVRSGLISGGVLLAVIALAFWLLTTVAGRDLLLAQIKGRLPATATLDWQRAEGPASGPMTLYGVRFTSGKLTFSAREVTLDPALRPLLGRRLRLDAMRIEGAILDLPPSDEPFELPRWPGSLPKIAPPLSLRADAIEVDGLRVTRQSAPLIDIRRLRGGLDAQNGRLYVRKMAIDSDRGTFAVNGHYLPAENYRTDLVATGVVPMRGSRTPLRLGLVARGDLAAMDVGIAGAAPAPVRATLELRGQDRPRWNLRARADGLDLAALGGNPDAGTPPMQLTLRADGVGGQAQVAGEMTQGETRVAVRPSKIMLERQVLAFAPLDVEMLGGRLLVRGRGDFGPRRQSRVDYTVVARDLRWGEDAGAVTADGEFGLVGTQARWALAGKARLARAGQRAQLDLQGIGQDAQLTVQRLQARMPTGTLDATGRVAWRPSLDWDLRAQLAGFDPGYFAPGWEGQLHGPLRTTGRQPRGGELVARVDVPQLGGRLRGRRVGASAQVDIRAGRYAGVAALNVDGGRLTARGSARFAPVLEWDVATRLQRFDPSFLVAGWPGAVDGEFTTRGRQLPAAPGRTPQLEARFDVPRLGGTLRGRALAGRGQGVLRGDEIRGDVQLSAGASRIAARGVIGRRLDIDARLSPLQLQDLLPGASGGLRGTVRITGPRNAPDIAADLTGNSVAYGKYRIGSLTARGRLPWHASGGAGALRVRGTGLQLGMPLRSLDVDARGSVEALTLSAEAQADAGRVALAGTARKRGPIWQSTLARLRLAPTRGPAWTLQRPTSVSFGGGRFTLAPACLSSGAGGALCANADWPRRGVDISGRGLPLTLVQTYLPQPSDGSKWQPTGDLAVTANIRPVGGSWRGQATITSAGGSLRMQPRMDYELIRYTALTLRSTFDPQRLQFDVTAGLNGGRIDARIATGWDAHSPLAGTVTADTRELTWLELFSPDIAEPQGHLAARIGLSGTRAVPLLSGRAQLTGFNTELPALGVELTQGQLTLDALADGSARINGRVRSGEGVLGIDGNLAWRRTGAPLLLNLRGNNVEVANTRQLRAVIDPNVTVRVDPGQPITVGGQVVIPQGLVQLERLDKRVKVSRDVVVLDPANPVAGGDGTGKPKTPLALDLTLIAGDDVRLQGFGLDGNIEGRLRVTTAPGRPLVGHGRMAVSGRYVAYGQRLEVTRGDLTWTGGPVNDPQLDMRAERRINDVTAGIDIRGRATRPRANVWSSTGQTQSEALSYLALGRSPGSLGSEQGRQVSAASAALSAGGSLLASELGARLGLDDSGVIESRTLGGSVFGIGKYLSPRLYVGYGVSLLGTGQVLTLKYLIRHGVDLEFESGSVETRGSLNYRREK